MKSSPVDMDLRLSQKSSNSTPSSKLLIEILSFFAMEGIETIFWFLFLPFRPYPVRYSLSSVPGSFFWQTLRHLRMWWMCWILQGTQTSIEKQDFGFSYLETPSFLFLPIRWERLGTRFVDCFLLLSFDIIAFHSSESPVCLQGQKWGCMFGWQDSSQPMPRLPSPQMCRSWHEQRW